MTTTALLARRFLADAARTPVNLLTLVLVPVVFVAIAAPAMEASAKLFGGTGGPAVQTATAGWAAGFIAATAMYFQLRAARSTDRRLVLAGLTPARLTAARLATGLALAVAASAAALVTLAARTDITHPGRVLAGTLMYAVIYLAIGALVGAAVANPVNGIVLILFVWIVDVFFGPALTPADRLLTRPLPTHFVTLWMMDLPSHHARPLGDLGWALAWTAVALAVSWLVVTLSTRVARPRHRAGPLGTVVRMSLREAGRNRVLWALLVLVPVVFVLLAVATTPPSTVTALTLHRAGHTVVESFRLRPIHGGLMAPIAIAPLAAVVGLFTVLDAREADARLGLAGLRARHLLTSRLTVVALGALLATAASLAATATVFHARQWGLYIAANVLVALVYGLLGVMLGTLFGRVGGVLVAFLLPFVDLGVEQSPMLHPAPPGWAHVLPGYGPTRMLYDAGLTNGFDDTGPLLLTLGWLAVLALAATLLFRRTAGSRTRAGT